MAKIKGSAFDSIRRILKLKGDDFKTAYYAKLEPQYREEVESGLSVTWKELNIDEQTNALVILAKMLYPQDYQAIQTLGHYMAKEMMPRFYQIFIRIPSPEFVFKRAAKIWASFYDTGEMSTEKVGNNEMTLVLKSFPDYPKFLRDYLCGYIKGIGELIHAKHVQVTKVENDSQAWKWKIQWSK